MALVLIIIIIAGRPAVASVITGDEDESVGAGAAPTTDCWSVAVT